MTTETTKTSILAGKLTKTHFATEQERLEEFARAMAVSSQTGESIKGADGKDGSSGAPGPAGQDGATPQAVTTVHDVQNGQGFSTPIVITNVPSPADVTLKLVWTGEFSPATAHMVAFCDITGTNELSVFLDSDVAEDGWQVYLTYWEATP